MSDETVIPELRIPWKVIAASPDMMDIQPGNRRFPYVWHSSLAISVFEPQDNLPDGLCDQTIAFIKVTCSITGYQPLEGQTSGTEVRLSGFPREQVGRLLTEYWGCYGILLNVAMFGQGVELTLENSPHILDFLPKSRELERAVTTTGEVLTASTSSIRLDNSLTTTEKNETEIGIRGGYSAGDRPGWNVEGSINHTWGTTRERAAETGIASGGERRTVSGYSTSIDHLYTLLTGYHAGTNRAVFIMLPRPFIEQPTDRLTFAPGLRIIEGIQEFIFVVSRPTTTPGLCVEVSLNTGHFPSTVQYDEQPPEIRPEDRRTIEFSIVVFARGSVGFGIGAEEVRLEDSPSATFRTPEGWIIDGSAIGHGVEEIADTSTDIARNHLHAYSVQVVDSRTVRVTGLLRGRNFAHEAEAILQKTYRVHLLREEAINAPTTQRISTTMLTTTRHLQACYISNDGCPQVTDTSPIINPDVARLVRENRIVMPGLDPVETQIPGSPYRYLTRNIQATLATTLLDSEYASPPIMFSDTDYFKDAILKSLRKAQMNVTLSSIPSLPEKYMQIESLQQTSLNNILNDSLSALQTKTGLSVEDATELRHLILTYLAKAENKA